MLIFFLKKNRIEQQPVFTSALPGQCTYMVFRTTNIYKPTVKSTKPII